MENREELKRFQADMTTDRALYRKLEEIGRRMLKEGSTESGCELMAKAAKELGYSVTAAELERAEAAAEVLDDNQLEAVSGGGVLKDEEACTYFLTCNSQIVLDVNELGDYCRRFPYNAAEDPNLLN